MVPNRTVARAYVSRGAFLWLITRAAITFALVLSGATALRLSTMTLIELVLLVVALGWIETRRRRESVLLANLGVSPLTLSVFFGLPAVIGELVVFTASRLIA